MSESNCPCHCHNNHDGKDGTNGKPNCKCIPICMHCQPTVFDLKSTDHLHHWDFAGRKTEYSFNGMPYEVYVICHECGAVEERIVKT